MTAWELFNTNVGGAIILGTILAFFAWLSARDTNRLMREGKERTRETLERMDRSTRELLERMRRGVR